MQPIPLRTTVIGSYPFPGWLEFACEHLDQFGPDDLAEMQDDAVCGRDPRSAVGGPGCDYRRRTDSAGFQPVLLRIPGRHRTGISQPATLWSAGTRPARQASDRGTTRSAATAWVPSKNSADLRRLAPPGPVLKASVPGPYTMSGRLAALPGYTRSLRHHRSAAAVDSQRTDRTGRGRLPGGDGR